MGRSPMVAASFMPRKLRPGGPVVYYLSASIRGESRHRYVRKGEVAVLAEAGWGVAEVHEGHGLLGEGE